jgi:hypothetical protein
MFCDMCGTKKPDGENHRASAMLIADGYFLSEFLKYKNVGTPTQYANFFDVIDEGEIGS